MQPKGRKPKPVTKPVEMPMKPKKMPMKPKKIKGC